MDNLLLFYIITLLVAAFAGMSIVLRIIRSLPFMGMNYHTPAAIMASTETSRQPSEKGGFSSLLFLVFIAAIFWMLFIHSSDGVNEKDELEQPAFNYNADAELTSHQIFPEEDTQRVYLNQSPTEVIQEYIDKYTIQLLAVSSPEKAEAFKATLHLDYPVIVIYEDGLYKVLVTGFASRKEAKDYQIEIDIEGFVKAI